MTALAWTSDWGCRAAFVDSDPDLVVSPLDGLPVALTYVVAVLETSDGTRRWMPIRGLLANTTRSYRPLEAPRGGDYSVRPELATGYAGAVVTARQGDLRGCWREDGSPIVTTDGVRLAWEEAPVLHLEGPFVVPACQVLVDHPTYPMAYTSRGARVAGIVDGQPVDGMAFFDTVHLPAGLTLQPSPYFDDLQIAWCGFVNELSDGTYESGVVIVGFEGFRALAVQRAGRQLAAIGDVEFGFDIDEGTPPFPRRAWMSGGGETLVWDAIDGGRWPIMTHMHPGHRFQQGVIHRAAAEADVVRSWAWLETYLPRISAARHDPDRAGRYRLLL